MALAPVAFKTRHPVLMLITTSHRDLIWWQLQQKVMSQHQTKVKWMLMCWINGKGDLMKMFLNSQWTQNSEKKLLYLLTYFTATKLRTLFWENCLKILTFCKSVPTSLATFGSKLNLCYFLNVQTRDTGGTGVCGCVEVCMASSWCWWTCLREAYLTLIV